MKRHTIFAILLILIISTCSFGAEYRKDRILVQFEDTGPSSPLRDYVTGPLSSKALKGVISNIALQNTSVEREYRIVPELAVIKIPVHSSVYDAITNFFNTPGVKFAEPDYLVYLTETPDDPGFPDQWAHQVMESEKAWDVVTGSSDVNVAVIDTGIHYTHEDLSENIWFNDGEDMDVFGLFDPNDVNNVDDDDNGYIDDVIGYDFAGEQPEETPEDEPDPDPDPNDFDGHGTHVAGIIGAVGNNAIGITGVNWNTSLAALKVFPDEGETASFADLISAVEYADDMEFDVANMSLGSYGYVDAMRTALNNASDTLFIASAGNDGLDTDTNLHFPSGYDLDNIISVMATNEFDQPAGFTNYGLTSVDLAAPGVGILSTYLNQGYTNMSGTSMAAPQVAGAAALLLSQSPDLTIPQVRLRILSAVDRLDSLEDLCVTEGRLNLYLITEMIDPGDDVFLVRSGSNVSSHNSIQAAIDASMGGDVVVAEQGNWFFENIDFKGKDIRIVSGDTSSTPATPDPNSETTFISGRITDPNYLVTFNSNETSSAILEGFTLEGSVQSAIYCNNSDPSIKDCIIKDNQALDGGAIYCSNANPTITDDCMIYNNTAERNGGGIYLNASVSTIEDVNIFDNTASSFGGAICLENNSTLNLTGIPITGNTLSGSTVQNPSGAGIYAGSSTLNLENITIANNNTDVDNGKGGGIFLSDSDAVITECNFTANNAKLNGGAIFIDSYYYVNNTISIQDTQFKGNQAAYGGALFAWEIRTDKGDSLTIDNCLFAENQALSNSGASIYFDGSYAEINNSTFADNIIKGGSDPENKAGAAIFSTWAYDDTNISDSIFANNQGVALYEDDSYSNINVNYSLFFNNGSYDLYDYGTNYFYTSTAADPDMGGIVTNCVYGDPLFVTAKHGDYYLSNYNAGQLFDAQGELADPNSDANSPAIDAGSDTSANLNYDNTTTRTDHTSDDGLVDLGFHYLDTNVPSAVNLNVSMTGYGSGSYFIDPNVYTSDNTISVPAYSHVKIKATPDQRSMIDSEAWTGVDWIDPNLPNIDPNQPQNYDPNSIAVVKMTEYKQVEIEYTAKTIRLSVALDSESLAGNVKLTGWQRDRNDTDKFVKRTTDMRGNFLRGTKVYLEAEPAKTTYKTIWNGTSNDSTFDIYNTVVTNTQTNSQTLTVKFVEPVTRNFPSDPYATVQDVIDASNDGDTIILKEHSEDQPYTIQYGLEINGKAITIQSENPDDANCVAGTVITMSDAPGSFVYPFVRMNNVSHNTIINGITFRDMSFSVNNGINGSVSQGRPHGADGGSAQGLIFGLYSNSSPTIKNCRFENLYFEAGDGGDGDNGAADWPGPSGNGNGFDGGWPGKAQGGAIYVGANCNPLIINCTFEECIIQGGNGGDGGDPAPGAALGGRGGGWNYRSNAPDWYQRPWYNPTDSIIVEREPKIHYSGRGGAIFFDQNSIPYVENCTFINCESRGGLNGVTGAPNLEPAQRFEMDNSGGAIFLTNIQDGVIKNCNFVANSADANLPTEYENDKLMVSYGGAVAAVNCVDIDIENCTFRGNTACQGGAIYGKWSEPRPDTDWNWFTTMVHDSEFTNNSAYHGGAAYYDYSKPWITNSEFIGNSAHDFMYPDANDMNSVGGDGGAIAVFDANAYIADCNISDNYSQSSGGGILLRGSNYAHIKNNLISGNISGRDGGGISVNWYYTADIENCTIYGNLVRGNYYGKRYGGGLYCSYSSYANVINSILWGNVASYGGQIAVGAGFDYNDSIVSEVDITHSVVQPAATNFYDINDLIDSESAVRPGFDEYTLEANDDDSTERIPMGFSINFFGNEYNMLYVNNNGNVTFDQSLRTFTPFGLTEDVGIPIIAPFFADIDTRDQSSGLVTYGTGVVDGNDAFGVNWIDVGYYNSHAEKRNSFQLVLISRPDRGVGDFDIEFNYSDIRWETGDASGGTNGFGGDSARVGFTKGTGNIGTYYELDGSGTHGAFLNNGSLSLINHARKTPIAGRYIFNVTSGAPEIPPGQSSVYVGTGCDVNNFDVLDEPNDADPCDPWDPNAGIIESNPDFVKGYYLYQNNLYQGEFDPCEPNSPCVDAGLGLPNEAGMYHHTTRIDHVQDTNIIDIGYHYVLNQQVGGDFNYDGKVNVGDYSIISRFWLSDDCDAPDWCWGADINRDHKVNFKDQQLFFDEFMGKVENNPPMPDPLTWEYIPNSNGPTSIVMTATTAIDDSRVLYDANAVEYQYKRLNLDNTKLSAWDSNTTMYDTGLTTGERYYYRIRARDKYGNTTQWSEEKSAVPGTPNDENPPTPDPMEWAVEPYATSNTSISMTAATASDESGVEYYFECVTGDANVPDSGWVMNPEYTFYDLTSNTYYGFRVKARDTSEAQNETLWSDIVYAITSSDANGPDDPNGPVGPTEPIPPEILSSYMEVDEVTDYENAYYDVITIDSSDDVAAPLVEYNIVCLSPASYLSTGWFDKEPGVANMQLSNGGTLTFTGDTIQYRIYLTSGTAPLQREWKVQGRTDDDQILESDVFYIPE